VAFARRILELERRGAPNAQKHAEELEAWTCAAVGELTALIARGEPRDAISAEDVPARKFLNVIYAAMICLMLVARRIRLRLAARFKAQRPVIDPLANCPRLTGFSQRPAFIDTG